MAYRDKSQGFAFVYVDIKKLLESKKSLDTDSVEPKDINQYLPPEKSTNVVNLNRDSRKDEFSSTSKAFTKPKEPKASPSNSPEKTQAIAQIRKNLDRLQRLHHKLHTMLDDLNKASEWRKKKD